MRSTSPDAPASAWITHEASLHGMFRGVQITRRQLLAASAAVPVIGALGVGMTTWSWWDRPAGEGLKALSGDEHAFVQSLAEAWMPRGGRPSLSGADARLGDFFDEVIAAMDPQTGKELRLLLHALDHLPLPRRGGTFQSLALTTRSEVLSHWMDHPSWMVRDATAGVMVMVGMGWTTHPDVVSVLRPLFRCGYGR